jgi:hypothetical protein
LLIRDSARLVELPVIAQEFDTLMDDTYLAGLWKRDFTPQLGWYVHNHALDDDRSTKFVAPSWSWASIKKLSDIHTRSSGTMGLDKIQIRSV